MGKYNVHAGHCPQGKGAFGAVGILKESVEDRLVKDEVIRLLKAQGHTVYDCTCEENTTQQGCLSKIVAKCNKHSVDLDISIHLNSGRKDSKGDNDTGGVEVYNYDSGTKAISDRICANIAKALGIRNRGTKYDKSLYVLANTKSKALLVECCFVDDRDDAERWDYKKCAKAIVEGVLGKSVPSNGGSSGSSSKPSSGSNKPSKPSGGKKDLGKVDIFYAAYAGGKWWPEVKNNEDWAGKADNVPIKYIGFRVSVGSVKVRAYTRKNGWLPYITFRQSYDKGDLVNGVVGDGSDILAVEIYYNTPSGYNYKFARYKVSVGGNNSYYAVQIDNSTASGMDGYAGDKKNAIDKIQAWIS